MKKIITLCFLMALVGVKGWAQPTVLGTSLVNGTYTTYNLNAVGGFKQYRLQATSPAAISTRVWEFTTGTAASTNYTTNWRPYTSNNILSPNIFTPTSFANGAKYNTGSGGSSGLLPAITSGNYYTFDVSNNVASDNVMQLLETNFNPVAISSVAQAAGTFGSRTVTITTSAIPASGENIYVRYSANSYSSSTLVQATGSGTSWTATIPWQSSAVSFYVYTSNKILSAINADVASYGQGVHDMSTLNLNNNNGANYSWTPATGAVIVSSSTGTFAGGIGYPSLTNAGGAFAAINGASSGTGAITVLVTADVTTEAGTTALNASTNWTSIGMQPSGARTISGSVAAPLIDLNGADNVTIDGLNDGTNALTIVNTTVSATTGTSTIRLYNDATNNIVQNCIINGAGTGLPYTTAITTANIIISAGTSTGNDGNQILNNTLGQYTTNYPSQIITSVGSSASISNDNITISGNNIHDYYSTTGMAGINVGANSSAFTISSNKFYQTIGQTGLASANYSKAIVINTATGGSYNISNNIIGYNSSTGTAVMTNSGGRFTGIELTSVSTTSASNIQGNTINGINWTTASSAASLGGAVFNGIYVGAGLVNIGSTTANIIGAATGIGTTTSNLYVTTTTSGSGIFPIYITSTVGCTISGNKIGAIATGGTGAIGYTFYGIALAGTGSPTVSSNIIGGVTSNAVAIGTNGTTTATTTLYGIYTTATGTPLNISSNTISNCSSFGSGSSIFGGIVNATSTSNTVANYNSNIISNNKVGGGSSTFYGICEGLGFVGSTTLTASNNQIYSNTVTGASGSFYGIRAYTSVYTFNTNQIYSNSFSANSGTSSSNIYGIYDLASPTSETITGNTINNLTIAGSSTSVSNLISGIYTSTSSGTKNWSGNTINTLTFNNSSIGAVSIYGIFTSSSSPNIFKNKIYDLNAINGPSTVFGIYVSGGTTVSIYNNIIGDLKAPAYTSSTAPYLGVAGLYISSGTTVNAYYNTIYLNATSTGTNFGSAAVYATSTPTTIVLKNNIFSNASTPKGSGYAVGYLRSSSTITNYSTSSNNNDFYGTSGLYYDGTTLQTSLSSYKTLMSTRDQASFSENPTFVSTTGSTSTYLHINTTTPTQIEGGGSPVSGITDDYDGDTRNTSTPDVGADEFAGVSSAPTIALVTGPVTACSPTTHPVSVNVSIAGGATISTVTLFYSGGVTGSQTMTLSSGTNTNGVYIATIPAGTAGSAVSWSVTATSSTSLTRTYNGTSYTDAPLTGVTATASASPTTICSGGATTLSGTFAKSGTATLGAGATTGSSYDALFYHLYGGLKSQFLVKASELTALGLKAGNITGLGINMSTVTTFAYNGFAINIASTNNTDMSAGLYNGSFTQTYSASSYTPVTGTNTFTFSTPFTWDGTSNIVIQFCWSNATTGGTSNYAKIDAQSFVSCAYFRADSQSPATLCGSTGASTTSNRPQFIFTGNFASALSTYSWSDGTSTVGSTNPLPVSPTNSGATSITKSYTVTGTDANGCFLTSSPTTVTVNPLPTAPVVTNNNPQCGTGTPSATLTDPNGFATPTYKWYNASNTLLQSGTSSTFTGTISTTTTFFVTVTGTGCESAKTSFTVAVTQPDPVAANANGSTTPPAVCLNSTIALTAVQTGNNNSYAFTWTCTSANASTAGLQSTTGTSVNALPTAAGTYTYQVTASASPCTTVSSVTITVNALPSVSSASASPTTICVGGSSTLTATNSVAGNVTIGTGTTLTGATVQPTAFCNRWAQYWSQSIFTATELQAAGLRAGNITSLTYTISTLGDDSKNTNFKVLLGTTSSTTLSAFVTTGLTQVYSAASYTHAVGANAITFTTPFTWDGTSNIIVDTRHDGVDLTNNAQTYYTSTSGNATVYAFTSTASSATTLQDLVANSTVTPTATTTRLNVVFGGQVGGSGSYSWAWNPGNLSGSSVTVSPTSNTSYTATVTNTATNCSANSSTVTVTVNPLPTAPIANNSIQCGTGVPTASITDPNNYTNPTVIWYSAATGGTVLQTGTSKTYTSSISTTTTFYVSVTNPTTGCQSLRTAVTVTVNTPDAVTASASPASACLGSTVALSATKSGSTNTYAYTWTAISANSSTAGITTNTGSSISVTPTAAGAYTYQVAAVDATLGCNTSATVNVTINPLPTITSVTATPATICAGGSSTLTALTGSSTTFNVGQATDASANLSSLGGWGMYFSTTNAATINSVNIYPSTAGNITITLYNGVGTGTPVTSKTFSIVAGDISTTVQKNLALGFSVPAGSTGWHIDYDLAINRGAVGTYTYPSTSNGFSITGNTLDGNNISSGSRYYFYNWNVTTATQGAGTYNWVWSTGQTGSSISVSPTATTNNYTVTATDPATGCSATSSPVMVTVNPLPTAPTATNSTQCGTGVPAASVADANNYTTPTVIWYSAATSGTVLQTGTSKTYTSSVSATTTFYVTVSNPATGCESGRTAVTVTVNTPPAVTANANGSNSPAAICLGANVTLTATSSSSSYTYSWASTTGSGISGSVTGTPVTVTPTAAGNYTYTVTGTGGGCTATNTVGITVNAPPTGITVSASPSTICSGSSTTLTASSASTYCTPTITTHPGVTGDYINNFTFANITNNNSGDAASDYTYYNSLTANVVANGTTTYNISLTAGGTTSLYAQYFGIWIDYNQNGIFEASELVFTTSASTYSPTSSTGSITIPTTAYNGTTRMRVVSKYTPAVTSSDACTFDGYGEYEDYNVSITGGVTNPAINYTYAWYDGTTNIGNTNPLSISPTNTDVSAVTKSYTAVITNTSGCSTTTSPVSVTINPSATASFTTSTSSVCYGTQASIALTGTANSTVTYHIDGGITNYTALIGSGGTGSITTSSSLGSSSSTTNHTFTLVSASNNTSGCSQSISGTNTVTVYATPTVALATGSQNPSVCKNNSFTITFTLGGSATGATVTITPGINVTSSVSSSTVTITGTPSASGTYTVTTTGSGGNCSATISGTITLQSYISWTGATDNKWNTAGNWCSGSVPISTDDVIIPSGVSTYPSLQGDITVNSVTLNSGATVNNNGYTLTAGTISGSGTITGSATSSLVTKATSTVNFTTGFNMLKNLTVSAGTLTLGNALSITGGVNYGIVTIANNAKLISNGRLTLKSDTLGTAAIAANTSNASYITGNVITEQFIPITNVTQTRTGRAWRLMTAPVSNTTIGAAWQENMLYDGSTYHTIGSGAVTTAPAGYGTMITGYGQGTAGNANGNGYDFWSAVANTTSSIRSYQAGFPTGSWVSLTAISNKDIGSEPAYMLFVRGDRKDTTQAEHTTLRAIGTVNQISKTFHVDGTKARILLGNPFPSSIDWASIYNHASSYVQDKFLLWDSKLSSFGAYVLIQKNGSSYSAVPLDISGSTLSNDNVRFIPSGAGFLVYPLNNSVNNDVSIVESDKNAGQVPPANPFRLISTDRKLYVNLNLKDSDTSATLADGLLARFDNSYDTAINNDDATKQSNFNENLGILSEGNNLIVEARPDVQKTDTLHMNLWNVKQRAYQLQMKGDNWTSAPNVHAYLVDNYLATKQEVSLAGSLTTVNFTVNTDSASWKSDRFSIVFQNDATVLPVTLTSVKAAAQNGGVNVSWTVTSEQNIKTYTVERSINGGNSYTAIGSQQAKNQTAAAMTNYQSFDAAPQMGSNLYRIRIETKEGVVTYSSVVTVVIGQDNGKILITLYPNPVRPNGKVSLQMSNLATGTYLVNVYSQAGQTVYQKKITISQANTTQSEELKLGGSLAQGSYEVRLTNSKSEVVYADKLVVGR